MTDWKEQLNQKEKELNLKEGGENNVRTWSNSNDSSFSSNSNRLSLSKERRKDIKFQEKGGKIMITVDAALKDLEVIEAEATDAGAKSVVKALKVIVKFLSTIRSNQLLTDTDKVRIQKTKAERQAKEVKE